MNWEEKKRERENEREKWRKGWRKKKALNGQTFAEKQEICISTSSVSQSINPKRESVEKKHTCINRNKILHYTTKLVQKANN